MQSRLLQSYRARAGVFRWSGASSFSDTAPQAAVVEGASSSEGVSASANPVGSYYHDLVYRGRGHNALKLGDLRKLMQMCDTPELARYSLQAVHLYQRKGQDFSEEVNSHFVRSVAIDGKQAVAAAKVMAKWKNRIGAWSTTTSLEKLLGALVEQGPYVSAGTGEEDEKKSQEEVPDVPALVVDLLEVSLKKGVFMNKAVFEVAIQLVPEQAAAEVTTADTDAGVMGAEDDGDNSDSSDEEDGSDSSSDSDGESSSSDEDSGDVSVAKKQPSLHDRLHVVAVDALGEGEASALFA